MRLKPKFSVYHFRFLVYRGKKSADSERNSLYLHKCRESLKYRQSVITCHASLCPPLSQGYGSIDVPIDMLWYQKHLSYESNEAARSIRNALPTIFLLLIQTCINHISVVKGGAHLFG